MSNYYILHHFPRKKAIFNGKCIFYENNKPNGNICPYIFNDSFVHTFCKMTQIKKSEDSIIFWVNANTKRKLVLCDIVFYVRKNGVVYWDKANNLNWKDAKIRLNYLNNKSHIYKNHFSLYKQHPLSRKRRVSLFADPEMSFQPVDKSNQLVNIYTYLKENLGIQSLDKRFLATQKWVPRIELTKKQAKGLYDFLWNGSKNKVFGHEIKNINPRLLVETN